jgi:HlyD family secretion protein
MMKYLLMPLIVVAAMVIMSCADNNTGPHGSGMIEATESVISAQATGRLEQLHFDEGYPIAAGDTIGIIDTTTVVLQLKQSRAARGALVAKIQSTKIQIEQAAGNDSLAQKEFNRISSLIKVGSANQQQFDQAKNARDQAHLAYQAAKVALQAAQADLARTDADIALLEEQYNHCLPLSPLNGTVVIKYAEEGELLSPGKPIIKIAQLDTVWVKIYVPPHDLTQIKLGGKASVDPEDGHTQPLSGTVTWISDEAEFTPKNVQTKEARADLVYAVKVTLPNPDGALKVGMPVLVTIP